MLTKRTRRRGFSITELLVVMAVVAAAVAITIPSVLRAREAARRLQCKNNLRQVGLALHNYHESFGSFPSGFIGVDAFGRSEVSGPTGWGWAAMVLPQMDQGELYSQINFSASVLDESNTNARRTGVESYRCPSDPASNDCVLLAKDGITKLATVARANYVGNFGTGSVSYCNNLVGLGMKCDSSYGNFGSGIFYHNSSISVESIVDGTSNTIMVSERAAKQDSDSTSVPTWVGTVPFALEGLSRNLGSVQTVPSLAINHGAGFTSAHPGVVEALMADGHVRDVAQSMSYEVLISMASRNGGSDLSHFQTQSFNFGIYSELPQEQGAVDKKSKQSVAATSAVWPRVSTQSTARARHTTSAISRRSHPAIGLADRTNRSRSRLSSRPVSLQPAFTMASNASLLDFLSSLVSASATQGTLMHVTYSRPTGSIFSPHHTGGDPNEEQHYLVPFPDGSHASWGGFTPDSVGPLTIKYDFRAYNGSPNNITAGQQARAVDALNTWAEGTCGKLVFVQDASAPADDVIIIGTGSIGAAGCGNDPGILGCGGGLLNDHTIFGGVAWQNQDAPWDEVLGNGDPPNTFDYFTVVAQEIGHALGLGHPDDVGGFGCCGTNIMNGLYGGEQTGLSDMDIDHIQSLYGDDCDGGPGGDLPPGWIQSE